MKGRRRGSAAAALGFALSLSVAGPMSGAAAEATALQDFGACVGRTGTGDLLLLVDESGSLHETDPDDARVTAASYLVEQLASSSQLSGYSLDVSVATFSSDYTTVLGWTGLDDGLGEITTSIRGLAEADRGVETDYWNALEGARRALADRAAAGQSSCQAVAWFSDGQLDLEPRDTRRLVDSLGQNKVYAPGVDLRDEQGAQAGEAAAQEQLCRDGGLADQLHTAGVVSFGVGLSPSAQADDTFDLMRSIATGEGCGALTDPVPGEFVLAQDIDDLLFAFDRFATPDQPPLALDAGVCQGQVCAEQAHTFVLDDSIRAVHVLAGTDVDGVTAVLTPPGGGPIELVREGLAPGTAGAGGGAGLGAAWESGRTVSLDLERTGEPGWAGVWSLIFVDPTSSSPDGRSRSNIHITGDIEPAAGLPDEPFLSGETSPEVTLGLQDTAGRGIDPAGLLGTLVLSADLVARDGSVVPVASGLSAADLDDGVRLDLTDVPPGPVDLRLALTVTTADATQVDGTVVPGTRLEPKLVDVPLTVRPPLDFPTVGPAVAFGTSSGPADLRGTLTVTGPGCVWLRDPAPELRAFPTDVGAVRVSAGEAVDAAGCLQVAAGETDELELSLTTDEAGNGAIVGDVTVALAPLGEPERAVEVPVSVTADLRKPLDEGVFWLLLVAALLLGPALPLGLLFLLKWRSARIPARALAASLVPVHLGDGAVTRDGRPFAVLDRDLVGLLPLGTRGARRVGSAGVQLRTRTGWSPFGPAHVVVEAPGRRGASLAHPLPDRHGRARLPLAVHNSWVVLVDPALPSDEVTVLLLMAADAPATIREELAEEVRQRAPELAARIQPDEAVPASDLRRPDAQPARAGSFGSFDQHADEHDGGSRPAGGFGSFGPRGEAEDTVRRSRPPDAGRDPYDFS